MLQNSTPSIISNQLLNKTINIENKVIKLIIRANNCKAVMSLAK